MATPPPNLIIVKRIKKGAHGHHGGAWKIAYADFVTAMMAFFLLMWLIGSLGKFEREGIADYFRTPVSVAMAGGTYSTVRTTDGPFNGKEVDVVPTVNINPNAPNAKVIYVDKAKDAERKDLEKLKNQIEDKIKNTPELQKFKSQLNLKITNEGLVIQLRDIEGKPMFASGSADLYPDAQQVLGWLGSELNHVPNKLLVTGHTDAKPFPGGAKGYSNWELSVDRANATRRELISGGMNEDKIMRVSGLGSTDPADKTDPLNPINRRISIILLNKETEENQKNIH